jgi:pectate lyase
VLKYGRDTYGPKHTPLFVDGLNIHTHEPVKWISPKGDYSTATDTEEWILSNFASQQTLLRTLDGLSNVTDDAKYRQAATDAIRYMFKHVRTPSGLFYWGHVTAYDALGDTPRGNTSRESIKIDYPYYELMWKVNPDATKKLIEALWCAHVMDWSNLDFNRIGITTANLEEPWNHEYKGGPTFFKSKYGGGGFFVTATSLIQAGTTSYRLSRQELPLVWSKRLAHRYAQTRHPKTGIALPQYNNPLPPLGDDLKEHLLDPHTWIFPWNAFEETRYLYWPENVGAQIWLSLVFVGDTLGEHGREFTQWAIEELTAWGKMSYRKEDNSFIPILTDGMNIEGYVSKEYTSYAPKGAIAKPLFGDLTFFWAYAVAYRTTSDEFMWQMIRDITLGNKFGDIGQTPAHIPELQTNTTSSDVYGLLGFLELYAKTKKRAYLKMAKRIGDNIVRNQFYKGFFVPRKRHIYTRFDCFEPLALLNLHAATKSKTGSVPQVWPSCPLFIPPYRYKEQGVDRRVIYGLTESPEPPLSLQEAAAIGDVNLVKTLIESGTDVDVLDDGFRKTALHRAAMSGHKDVAEFLLAKGADVSARDQWPFATPLHYAAEKGHVEIAELLIANDSDVNAKDTRGRTPIDLAMNQGRKEIAKLLLSKSGDVSLYTAAYIGDLKTVRMWTLKTRKAKQRCIMLLRPDR